MIGLISCGLKTGNNKIIENDEIKIEWVNNLSGDYSFKDKWEYPEGVYKNEFGQLSCDGLCPMEIDRMVDEKGKIIKDSLTSFYQLVDTSHQFYSIESEAWTYEWAGTNFVTVNKVSKDSIIGFTHTNAATHSSLNFTIIRDKCIPAIAINSIRLAENKIFTYKGGRIKIDKNMWDKGVFKAEFDFIFDHKENMEKPMYWKGKIYTKMDTI
jgi:hypothetical protein